MAAMQGGYDVLPIAIRRDGTWVPGINDPEKLSLNGGRTEVGPSTERIMLPAGNGTQQVLVADTKRDSDVVETNDIVAKLAGQVDVVFPVLHGPFGEDGTIQGLLEMAAIPYVGCGVFASSAGMDKHYMKVVLQAAGLPVGPYVVVPAKRWRTDRAAVEAEVAKLQFPVFVKPARAGSSLGISKVDSIEGLEAAVVEAQRHDPKVIVEQGIKGREIECAVLEGRGDNPARASVLGEVIFAVPEGGFYDFEHKYVDIDGLTMSIPAAMDEAVSDRIRALAVAAFDAFGCEGLTRVDFFLTDDGEAIINEINTMPGFTPVSMYPVLWQNTGMTYSELVDELIALAVERPIGLR